MADHLPECWLHDPCCVTTGAHVRAVAGIREACEEYVARQRGGDHLPECIYGTPSVRTEDCIFCDSLRACEARVRGEWEPMDQAHALRGAE
jgi:hypothetical protein